MNLEALWIMWMVVVVESLVMRVWLELRENYQD